jgi:hypothetical protein
MTVNTCALTLSEKVPDAVFPFPFTVNVLVEAVVPFRANCDEESVQFAFAGQPLTERLAVSVFPPRGVTVIVYVAGLPPLMVLETGNTATEKSTAVPEREIDCGLLAALSLMLIAAESGPRWLGVKSGVIVHADPAPSVLGETGQLSLSLKSTAFVPVF